MRPLSKRKWATFVFILTVVVVVLLWLRYQIASVFGPLGGFE